MSEHVQVERRGPLLSVTLARPERRTPSPSRCTPRLRMQWSRRAAMRRFVSSPSVERARTLRRATTSPTSFRCGPAATTRSWCGVPARARLCETPDRRGRARKLRRHRHHNAPSLRPRHRRGRNAFLFAFVDLGLVPEAASSLLLPRMAGRRLAARYLLLAEPFGVDEALAVGLVSHRVTTDGLDDRVSEIVDQLLAKPPEALRETQRLLRHGAREEIMERMLLGERDLRRAPEITGSEGGDHRFLQKAKGRFPELV